MGGEIEELERRLARTQSQLDYNNEQAATIAANSEAMMRQCKQYEARQRQLQKQIPCKKENCKGCRYLHKDEEEKAVKTRRICPYWVKNNCKFGGSCRNLHSDPTKGAQNLTPENVADEADKRGRKAEKEKGKGRKMSKSKSKSKSRGRRERSEKGEKEKNRKEEKGEKEKGEREKGEKEKGRQGNEKGQSKGAMAGQGSKAPKFRKKEDLDAQIQSMKDPETQKVPRETQDQKMMELDQVASGRDGEETMDKMAIVLARQRKALERVKGFKDQENLSDSE